MPKFDEFNRKRGIQYYLEASKVTGTAMNTKRIDSLLSAKEDLSGYAAKGAARIGMIGSFGLNTCLEESVGKHCLEATKLIEIARGFDRKSLYDNLSELENYHKYNLIYGIDNSDIAIMLDIYSENQNSLYSIDQIARESAIKLKSGNRDYKQFLKMVKKAARRLE